MAERGPWFAALRDVPILFGLRAQGKLETVERMRSEGVSWEEIGQAIGWTANAVEEFHGYESYASNSQAKRDA